MEEETIVQEACNSSTVLWRKRQQYEKEATAQEVCNYVVAPYYTVTHATVLCTVYCVVCIVYCVQYCTVEEEAAVREGSIGTGSTQPVL